MNRRILRAMLAELAFLIFTAGALVALFCCLTCRGEAMVEALACTVLAGALGAILDA